MTQLKVFPNYVFLKEIQNSFSIEHIWISVSANGKIFQLLIPTPHSCTANMLPPLLPTPHAYAADMPPPLLPTPHACAADMPPPLLPTSHACAADMPPPLLPTPHACAANMPPPLTCAIAWGGGEAKIVNALRETINTNPFLKNKTNK